MVLVCMNGIPLAIDLGVGCEDCCQVKNVPMDGFAETRLFRKIEARGAWRIGEKAHAVPQKVKISTSNKLQEIFIFSFQMTQTELSRPVCHAMTGSLATDSV